MTDQKVNVTNYTHRDVRERAHSNITYDVGIFILQTARLKTSCLATKCLHANYLVVTIKIILKIIMDI